MSETHTPLPPTVDPKTEALKAARLAASGAIAMPPPAPIPAEGVPSIEGLLAKKPDPKVR